jgi:hypothetical protein
VAVEVWLGTHSWLGIITAVPWNISHSFESFVVPFKSKKKKGRAEFDMANGYVELVAC